MHVYLVTVFLLSGKITSASEIHVLELCGGMAERLKAHVLKTCLGHTNVGSNPTPSAIQPVVTTLVVQKKVTTHQIGEVPEWSNGAAC